jgi:formyl-CoA transferase
MEILCKADIPAGALLDISDITNDPQYLKRNMDRGNRSSAERQSEDSGFAPHLSENHIEYKCSPALGGSNEEIYKGVLRTFRRRDRKAESREGNLIR